MLPSGFVTSVPVSHGVSRQSTRCARRARHVTSAPLFRACVAAAADAPASSQASEQRTDVSRVVETPGGYIVDCSVTNFTKKTGHTVIVAKSLLDDLSKGLEMCASAELLVELVFECLMEKKHNLANTKGTLDSGRFPINYFSVRQLFYFFPDMYDSLRSRIAAALNDS